MNAKEAQKISESTKPTSPKNIDKLMEVVYNAIASAASKGDFATGDPFEGLRLYMTTDQRRAVKERLVVEGYTVYGGSEYIERISWATVS